MDGGDRVVAVAGATGFLGRYVVRELLARGWRVRALVRHPHKAQALPTGSNLHAPAAGGDSRLTTVLGTLEEGTAERLLAGAVAWVNLIGIIREAGGNTFRAAHVDAVRTLVRAAEHTGTMRCVHVSALGVEEEAPTEYQRTKFEGEMILRRSFLAWTIFRPGLIYGREGEFVQMAVAWARGRRAPWFFLPYFSRAERLYEAPLAAVQYVGATVQPVAVEDVAWSVAQALVCDEAVGEVIALPGPETITWPALLEAIRDAVPGAKPHLTPRGIPAGMAAWKARWAHRLGLGWLLPFDEGMARMGAMDNTADLAKARAVLGFQPRPLVPALTRAVAEPSPGGWNPA